MKKVLYVIHGKIAKNANLADFDDITDETPRKGLTNEIAVQLLVPLRGASFANLDLLNVAVIACESSSSLFNLIINFKLYNMALELRVFDFKAKDDNGNEITRYAVQHMTDRGFRTLVIKINTEFNNLIFDKKTDATNMLKLLKKL